MRRLVTVVFLAGVFGAGFTALAHACAPPAEGEPTGCCQPPPILVVTVDGHTASVPDPFWDPRHCL